MAARNTEKNGEKARFSVTLSGKGLAAVIVLFILGLAWTFVLGVLLGRGYNPEEAVPELARLMPEAAENASKTTGMAPGVLKPEELEFYEELQKKPEEVVETAKKAPEATPKPAAKSAPAKEPEQAADRAEDAAIYMYTYQTAAFRDAAQAEKFRARIEALGYSAGLETATYGGNTWHRVLVNFKGTPEETDSLKAALRGLGVEKPLLRGKKSL